MKDELKPKYRKMVANKSFSELMEYLQKTHNSLTVYEARHKALRLKILSWGKADLEQVDTFIATLSLDTKTYKELDSIFRKLSNVG